MDRYLKSLFMSGALIIAVIASFAFIQEAKAQGYPFYGASPYGYQAPVVVVQPLLLPRTGSNDYLYQYDNVYGAGASAAGRLDRVVVNPQPQLYYPRQPRVYIGY